MDMKNQVVYYDGQPLPRAPRVWSPENRSIDDAKRVVRVFQNSAEIPGGADVAAGLPVLRLVLIHRPAASHPGACLSAPPLRQPRTLISPSSRASSVVASGPAPASRSLVPQTPFSTQNRELLSHLAMSVTVASEDGEKAVVDNWKADSFAPARKPWSRKRPFSQWRRTTRISSLAADQRRQLNAAPGFSATLMFRPVRRSVTTRTFPGGAPGDMI